MSIKLSNFIIVNGHQYPAPKYYPNFQVTTATNAARNAANKVVGQKLSRDNYKIDSLEWKLGQQCYKSLIRISLAAFGFGIW